MSGEHPPAVVAAPERLVLSGSAAGVLLRQSVHEYQLGLGGAEAWMRACARGVWSRRRSWRWTPVLAPLAACLVLVVALSGRERTPPRRETPQRHFPSIVPLPASASLEVEPALPGPVRRKGRLLVPRRRAQALLAGVESALADGSRLRLGPNAAATLSAPAPTRTVVALERGTVGLVVAPRRAGTDFQVRAGAYAFQVVGTRFVVTADGDSIDLFVSEGTVAILAAGTELRRIGAGQRWSASDARRADDHPDGGEQVVPQRPTPDECRSLARTGAARAAVTCYQEVAAGGDLPAEMALYEVARLQRDALDDPRAALATLHRHRARFPRGALREEVQGQLLDLLVRTGDGTGALALSEELLAGVPTAERQAQLRMVRGNVWRSLLRDSRRAAVEYAWVETSAPGPLADEALFWRAVCLQQGGERERALAAFTRYLQRPGAPRAAEARARREELEP